MRFMAPVDPIVLDDQSHRPWRMFVRNHLCVCLRVSHHTGCDMDAFDCPTFEDVTTVPSPIYLRSRFRNNSVIISSIMTLLNLRSHLTAPISDSVLPTCSTSFVSQNAHAPSRPKPLPFSYKSSHVFTGFLSFEIEHDPLLLPKLLSASIPVLLSIHPCSLFTGARPPRLISLDL